jgi:hypothetical protein
MPCISRLSWNIWAIIDIEADENQIGSSFWEYLRLIWSFAWGAACLAERVDGDPKPPNREMSHLGQANGHLCIQILGLDARITHFDFSI